MLRGEVYSQGKCIEKSRLPCDFDGFKHTCEQNIHAYYMNVLFFASCFEDGTDEGCGKPQARDQRDPQR